MLLTISGIYHLLETRAMGSIAARLLPLSYSRTLFSKQTTNPSAEQTELNYWDPKQRVIADVQGA